ncbi:MAG: tripartite tricarboxylate transporter TctB family protein [Mobilitalea sp.]
MNKWLHNRNLVSGIILFLFSIWYYVNAQALPQQSEGGLAPSYFPSFLALILAILSLYVVVDSLIRISRNKKENEEQYEKKDHKTVAILILFLIVYIILFKYLGFIITTILYLTAAMSMLKAGKLIKLVPIAVIITLSIYFVFSKGFHIPLN